MPTIGGAPWCDDFELGTFIRWTIKSPGDSMAITSTDVYRGKYAARANTTGTPAWALKRWYFAEYYRLCFRIFFKHFSQGAGQTDQLMQFRDRASMPIATVFIAADGTLAYRVDVTGVTRSSSLAVTPGVYHELQTCLRITGLPPRVETYYDGAPVPELTRPESLGVNRIRELILGDTRPGQTHHDVFDDVAADVEVIG